MCSFSGDLSRFDDASTVVLGISCDNVESHSDFTTKYDLKTPLLADTDGAVCRSYGVLQGQPGYPERVLFVIDRQGVVRHVHQGMPDNDALLGVIQGLA